MKAVNLLLLFLLPLFVCATHLPAADTATVHELKGYKKLLYRIVSLHPKLNSAIEKDLLKHYLLGTGTTYLLSDSDFVRLKKLCPLNMADSICKSTHLNNEQYCYRLVDLNKDDYFGWGLGTISGIYRLVTGELISIADIYDFNKKKKGIRRFKNEFITRVFRLLAPSSAQAFVVTYRADGYFVSN